MARGKTEEEWRRCGGVQEEAWKKRCSYGSGRHDEKHIPVKTVAPNIAHYFRFVTTRFVDKLYTGQPRRVARMGKNELWDNVVID